MSFLYNSDTVRVATTTNISSFPPTSLLTIDGVTTLSQDKVLVKNQTTSTQNGIWIVQPNGVAWIRSLDPYTGTLPQSFVVNVGGEGTVNAHAQYTLSVSTNNIVIGTTPLIFAKKNLPANVKDFGAVGDGVTDDTAAFNTLISATTGNIQLPTGNYKITSSITFASTQTLMFEAGAILQPTASTTITINGNILASDTQQIITPHTSFSVAPLIFTNSIIVSVRWFGAAGDGTTNDYLSHKAANESLPNGGTIRLLPGIYRIYNANLNYASNIALSFDNGAMLKPDTSFIQIAGQIEAGISQQIFDKGTGRINTTFNTFGSDATISLSLTDSTFGPFWAFSIPAIKIIGSGALGTATFKYSADHTNPNIWSNTITTQTNSGSPWVFNIPESGLSITFNVGNYTATNVYVCNDIAYQWLTFSIKTTDKLSVMWFGAKGDGTTDDSQAIQACLGVAGNPYNPIYHIYFPAGNYKISNTIYVPSREGWLIEGVGFSSNLIWNNPAGWIPYQSMLYMSGTPRAVVKNLKFCAQTLLDTCIDLSTDPPIYVGNTQCHFEDLNFENNGANFERCFAMSRHGLDANNDFHYFENCRADYSYNNHFAVIGTCDEPLLPTNGTQSCGHYFNHCGASGSNWITSTADCSMTDGYYTLTFASGNANFFTAKDVQKMIEVAGAGSEENNYVLRTRITAIIDSHNVTLYDVCQTTTTSAVVTYGGQSAVRTIGGGFTWSNGGLGLNFCSDFQVSDNGIGPVVIQNVGSSEGSRALLITDGPGNGLYQVRVQGINHWASYAVAVCQPVIQFEMAGALLLDHVILGTLGAGDPVRLAFIYNNINYTNGYTGVFANTILRDCIIGSSYNQDTIFKNGQYPIIEGTCNVVVGTQYSYLSPLGNQPNDYSGGDGLLNSGSGSYGANGPIVIDWTANNIIKHSINGNTIFAFGALYQGLGTSNMLVVKLVGDAIITFPESVIWDANGTPISGINGTINIYDFRYDGTHYYGRIIYSGPGSHINVGANATAIQIGETSTNTTLSGNFDASGSSGTFKTTTGAVTIGAGSSAVTITGGASSIWRTSSGTLSIDSAAALNIGPTNATSIVIGNSGTSTGAAAINTIQTQTGANAISGTSAGQVGGAIIFTTGAGGAAISDSTVRANAKYAGIGGDITLTLGNGGAANAIFTPYIGVSARGGSFQLTSGVGGAGANTAYGSSGGAISFTTGAGGVGGTGGAGGDSGIISLITGTGGNAGTTTGIGGNSGAILITPGTGGIAGVGANIIAGAGGAVTITAGTGGAGNVGGSGTSLNGGTGGNISIDSGAGGALAGAGTAGAHGTISIGVINALTITIGNVSSTTTIAGATTATVTPPSDIRLKTNITDELPSDGLNRVSQWKAKAYEFKDNLGVIRKGFIAQELININPHAVHVGTDEIVNDKLVKPWTINYTELIPDLTLAIQELLNKNKALEEKIATLEEKLNK